MNKNIENTDGTAVGFFCEENFHGTLQYSMRVDGKKFVVNRKSVKPQKSGFYEYEVSATSGSTTFVTLLRGDRELGLADEAPLPEKLNLKFGLEKGRVVSKTLIHGISCTVLPDPFGFTPNDWCTDWVVKPVRTSYAWGIGPVVYVDVVAEMISTAAKRRRDRKVADRKRAPDTHTVIVRDAALANGAAAA